jgi:ribulose-phosphate 3-epimerase
MPVEIIPSILSADCARLVDEVAAAAAAGVTKGQIDVMDGHFVPNISVGIPVVRSLDRATDVLLDVHLMIEAPERYLAAFADAGADVLTVHAEATPHVHRAVEQVHQLGLLAGVAINPATPVVALEEILPDLDVALIMTVNPGFGGQAFIAAMLPKIRRLRSQIEATACRAAIQVDGGIDVDTAGLVTAAGAVQLVAGTAVFGAGLPVGEAVRRLWAAANNKTPAP